MRFLFPYFIFATVLAISAAPVHAQMETAAKQAFVMDYDTKMVLFEKNADERMPTSSMSKVVTMYAVLDAIKNGKLTRDAVLTVSEKAWRMGGSKMFVEVGKQVKVEDLMRGVIIQSGNDATVVLAEGIAGTEEAFAGILNAEARRLGMANSHFVNASGWPDPEHYSTARDLATLAWHTINDFPDEYHYYAEKEFTFHNIKQPNRNPLLYRNIGADGIKTGHTEEGGYGLMASGTISGRRVITVLNGMDSEAMRAQEGARLLEWGLKAFENITLFKVGAEVDAARVVLGKKDTVSLTVEKDMMVTLPLSVKNDLKVQVVYDGPLEAPLLKGQKVGVIRAEVPRVGTVEEPLVTAEGVERIGFFAGAFAKAKILLVR